MLLSVSLPRVASGWHVPEGRWYTAPMLDQFEFWTMKEGADGLTRISARPMNVTRK
jgi:hypothetical protein